MDVIVKKTPIPKMIGWLANYMLILVGVGVFYVKGFSGIAGVLGEVAFIAWTIAAADAILEHIKNKPDSDPRHELKEAIEEAMKQSLKLRR